MNSGSLKRLLSYQTVALAAVIAAGLAAVGIYSAVANGNSPDPSAQAKGCQLIVFGHLYSFEKYPEIMDFLVEYINETYPDASAIISLGDNTINGTEKEWDDFFAKYRKFKAPILFAPGNHDLRNHAAYQIYMDKVGYTSKEVKINNCNLVLANTVNQNYLGFNDVEMVKGGGLDDASLELLKNLSRDNENDRNLLFLHHALFSIGLVHFTSEWNSELNRIFENEKVWREKIQPLIKGKVDAVYAGDLATSSISYQQIDGIPYVGNSFGCAYGPEPYSDRRPLSFTVVNVDGIGNIDTSIDYLPVPLDSAWFAFDRDTRYQEFADDYDDNYDRSYRKYPNQ